MTNLESVTFKQLRALAAVAACGTMSAAAEQIGLTPPAVHTQLKLLEENLGARLLDRGKGQGTRLTRQGEAVLAAAHQVEAALAICTRRIRALNEGMEGQVNLGVVSTGKYFAPGLVAKLRKAYPKIEVQLRVGNRDSVMAWLENGSIDLAIMGRPPRAPLVTATPLGAHPHVMIAAPDHRLAGAGDVSADDLLDETFIAREQGSGTRILMDRFLDRLGEGRVYTRIEMDSNETIKQAVIAGLGLALISRHTVTEELHSGRLIELPVRGLPILRQWYLLYPSGAQLNASARRVHDFIQSLDGTFLPQ